MENNKYFYVYCPRKNHLLIMHTELRLVSIIVIVTALIIGSLFSCLETATVAVSEYRLSILKDKAVWAKYAYQLKLELNKVLIFSLFGNSLFNAIFTTLTTILLTALLHGLDIHFILPLATLFVALFIIIFSEAIPKIIAARSPLATLRLISIPLYYVYQICRPIVWLINKIVYSITKLLKVSRSEKTSLEELKAIIADKDLPFKNKHRSILLNSINLENVTIKEVLIPLRMAETINLNDNIEIIKKQIYTTHHTRVIVYLDQIDNILGFVHSKDVLSLANKNFTRDNLKQIIRPITFVHDFLPIIHQIHRAQKYKNRIFITINEYGDTLGITCLEDMFEIVFGNFTTTSPQQKYLAVKNQQNQLIVDGTMLIRELNESYHLGINLTMDALTVNGLVQKTLCGLPSAGVCFRLNNLIFEVINIGDYWVERVKISFF